MSEITETRVPVQAPQRVIGQIVARPNAKRLLLGQGRYVDDLAMPRLVHAAFVRSPYAHARIVSVDLGAALAMPGVVAAFDGPAIAKVCSPWVGVLTHFATMRSMPQHALAIDRARWQGEPVAVVLAQTRAQAEDAAQAVIVEWEELPAQTEKTTALEPDAIVIHPELGDNRCMHWSLDKGEPDVAFANAACVVDETFTFARHTGVTLESRTLVADYSSGDHLLTVHISSQVPHMMRDVLAKHLGLPDTNVRVISPDVGGSFGMKIHVYPDDMTVAACAMLLRRPVKFVADRMESFLSDIHVREHVVKGRIAVDAQGGITAFAIHDITGIGPFSMYPRSSGAEGMQVFNYTGAPYRHQAYSARLDVVFQNKVPTSQYRAVGHPIACAVTEGLVDAAARKLGRDPVAFRRDNVIRDDAYPYTSPTGMRFECLSHQAALEKLLTTMRYDQLRIEQAELRARGVHRGIGIAMMVELTNPGPGIYAVGGAPITSQDGATVRLERSGHLTVMVSVGEQGQGSETIFAQIAAEVLSVPFEHVKVVTGDTLTMPFGGGTWGSRGAGIGGETVLQATKAVKAQILTLATVVLNRRATELDLVDAWIVERDSGARLKSLADIAHVGYMRSDTLPRDFQPELVATRHFSPRDYPVTFSNGAQAAYVEVDLETGFVKLLEHWVIEDCGTIINPLLVDEQIRGGVVQGIGMALYEELFYSTEGQLQNGTLADYLVPMATELPDIRTGHLTTPTRTSELGAKGAGEAGTCGAPAAIMNALNDALAPHNATVTTMPFTPQRILNALAHRAR
jgi:aerobic carbon-monoxide dehydrogenase large subunit